ncbi:heavy metal transport/detoxification superfamily protein [Striga asiatica]|uniref:Heavy metal transport/detoxification superfamily protein n=1 Tax=Striga asiatica TaxID=4170 RepID=A0A5A7RGK7_STRAF|nr:heavy metal transport/detoxification superfamily protein [Striga asiatica]
MAAEKVTTMVLKVDLQCPMCYKDTKKALCKFPQVRDQIYDEKANTVTIKVLCCSPEKIRDKLCCKGGKAIKSITIVESGKPNGPDKPKEAAEKPKEKEKPNGPEKPKVLIVEQPNHAGNKPKNGEKPKDAGKPKNGEKPKDAGKPNDTEKSKPNGKPDKPKEAPKPEPTKILGPIEQMRGPEPGPVQGVPSVFPYVGPSYAGPYGFTGPAQPIYHEGFYDYGHMKGYECGYGYGYGYGSGRAANGNKCESEYSDEENQLCSIM